MPATGLPEPAFPVGGSPGITMRDYFAAAALSGMLTTRPSMGIVDPHGQVASAAYAYADAMMRARVVP